MCWFLCMYISKYFVKLNIRVLSISVYEEFLYVLKFDEIFGVVVSNVLFFFFCFVVNY